MKLEMSLEAVGEGMAQGVQHIPSILMALGSIPRTTKKISLESLVGSR
jgi:hypothetical protein